MFAIYFLGEIIAVMIKDTFFSSNFPTCSFIQIVLLKKKTKKQESTTVSYRVPSEW